MVNTTLKAMMELISNMTLDEGMEAMISIDRLEIFPKPIGSGATSTVFRGKYEGHDVAVKKFTDCSEEGVRRMKLEVAVLW